MAESYGLLRPRNTNGVLPVDDFNQMSTLTGQLKNWRRRTGQKDYNKIVGGTLNAGAAIGDAYNSWEAPDDALGMAALPAQAIVKLLSMAAEDLGQKTRGIMETDPNDPEQLRKASEMGFDLAADTMVGGSVAGMATNVPGKGTMLGSAIPPKGVDLPMDEMSRMARADEMFPIEAYHGTNKDFTEFGKKGSATNAASAKKAFWFSDDPKTAGTYSELAGINDVSKLMNESRWAEASKQWDKANSIMREAEKLDALDGKGENIIPARLGGNLKEVDMDGAKYDPDDVNISEILDDAANDGFDGVKLKNFSDEADYGTYNPSTHYAIFKPENIRSRHAKFDPKNKDKAMLLGANRSKGAGVLAATMQKETPAKLRRQANIQTVEAVKKFIESIK